MRYSIFLNAKQEFVSKLQKIEKVKLISIRQSFKKHHNQLPNIQEKTDRGEILDVADIHSIIELEAADIQPHQKEIIFTDYPQTLAQAQDLIHYAKIKSWTLNHCIYFKASEQEKKAIRARLQRLHSEEDLPALIKKIEKQQRQYKEILALLPFNQAQTLIADQNPLHLYQKVVRICGLI